MATANQEKINERFDFIEQWLPTRYSRDVLFILKQKIVDVKATYVRQVKRERIHNRKVISALFAVAMINKKQLEN